MAPRGVLLAIMLGCFTYVSLAGKILIATTPRVKSHTMNLKKIAEEIEQRGHSVMVSKSLSRPIRTLAHLELGHGSRSHLMGGTQP